MTFRVSRLFSDHMVLQRNREVVLWGWDAPSTRIEAGVAGLKAHGTADSSGRWQVTLPPCSADGTFELSVCGSESVTFQDVCFGEVWICSGQSNMEWPLKHSLNPLPEIASADLPRMRFFRVPKVLSDPPPAEPSARWQPCTPEIAGDFSAVAYYFGKRLLHDLDCPIGLIDTSWGGTTAEAWTPRDALSKHHELEHFVRKYDQAIANQAEIAQDYQTAHNRWCAAHYHFDAGNTGITMGWAQPHFDDSLWRSMEMPTYWSQRGHNCNGAFWFRRSVELPASLLGRPLTLSLGTLDDYNETYFNGVKVGESKSNGDGEHLIPRIYTIPEHLIRAGINHLAVRIFDRFGDGGMGGTPQQLWLGNGNDRLSLAGPWRYEIERALPRTIPPLCPPPVVPWSATSHNGPGVLFDNLIRPLTPLSAAGFLWYQGESNVGRSQEYTELFQTLITSWRSAFGDPLRPFLFAQLPHYCPPPEQIKAGDGWEELRVAQSAALCLPKTGMAVTLDLGDPNNIHPILKKPVGDRLADQARALVY
jgi:sialate O-acetylesterase